MFKITKGLKKHKEDYGGLPEKLFWSKRKQVSTGKIRTYLCAKRPAWTQMKVGIQLAYIADEDAYSVMGRTEKAALHRSIEQLVRIRFEGLP